MIVKLEDFNTGWYGLEIGMSLEEVDRLIERLRDLRGGRIDHFHCRSSFDESAQLGDIEFYVVNDADSGKHNLTIE